MSLAAINSSFVCLFCVTSWRCSSTFIEGRQIETNFSLDSVIQFIFRPYNLDIGFFKLTFDIGYTVLKLVIAFYLIKYK